ncbi:MAG: hypothetical protein IT521_05400 [Burkholderiales bacterium]|nr:hypothetical protein [Burkholderiales bacterium]
MPVIRTLAAFAVAATMASAAWAQATPPEKCEKPDPHPGRLASNEKLRGWTREVNRWQECMKVQIAAVQAKADQEVKEANAAVAASNAAINDYNAIVKEFQAQVEAAQ